MTEWRPPDPSGRQTFGRYGTAIGIVTGLFGALSTIGLILLPSSTTSAKALIILISLALSIAGGAVPGAWGNPGRFAVALTSSTLAVVFVVAFAIVARSDAAAPGPSQVDRAGSNALSSPPTVGVDPTVTPTATASSTEPVPPSTAAPPGQPPATGDGTDDGGRSDRDGTGPCPDSAATISTSSYCFTIPAGFTQVTDFGDIPGSGRETVVVGVGPGDAIALTVHETYDTYNMDDNALRAANDQALAAAINGQYVLNPPHADRLLIEGYRTFHDSGIGVSGYGGIEVYNIYRDHNKVQINCQYQTYQAAVRVGCQSLLDSFHTINP